MRKVAFILATVLLITKCVSAPIPYDTASIDDSKGFVGLSVQYIDKQYYESRAWDRYRTEYYKITSSRGDLGKSFIKRENFEFGLQGGMGGGRREYRYYVVDKYWYPRDTVVMRIVEHPYEYFGIYIFPYFKWVISSGSSTISLKFSLGIEGGYTINDGTFFAFPQLLTDLMFGMGNPEVLTLGISFRSDPLYVAVFPFASLHLGDFTFSVLCGYGPQMFYAYEGHILTFQFGVAKKFK